MRIIYISTKLLYTILIILIFLILCIMIYLKEFHRTEPIFLPITNRIIGIDPGHGGVDPGAVSRTGVKEDEINLKIALKLKRFIEQSGGIAVLTRDTDEGLYTDKSSTLKEMKTEDLQNRKMLIKESECEVFLTIHLNSFPQSKYFGAQTFYNNEHEESKILAYVIQDELKYVLDKENHRLPIHRDDVYLLQEVEIPTVLIEAGFLSNPEEEKLLKRAEYQEKVAWSIYAGIMKYFAEKEGL